MVKNLPASAEDAVDAGSILGQEDPPEEEMASHSNILAGRVSPMDRAGWRAVVQGVTQIDTTEHELSPLLRQRCACALSCFSCV